MTIALAQLSDLHIREPGRLAYGRLDTSPFLRQAVRTIMELELRPDAVVITGDLVDFGRPAEYAHLAELLAPLPMPTYLLPGNHDDRSAMRYAFPSHDYLAGSDFVQYRRDVGDLRLIALDTTVPGQAYGALCARRLAWLEDELDAAGGRPTILAMHHPPFDTLFSEMDRNGLREGARELEALVSRHRNVERILCGHLHRSIDVRFGGTIASTAPSPAHQLHFDLRVDAEVRWCLEPPALKLHVWASRERLITHTVACGRYEGPYPFYDKGVLID